MHLSSVVLWPHFTLRTCLKRRENALLEGILIHEFFNTLLVVLQARIQRVAAG